MKMAIQMKNNALVLSGDLNLSTVASLHKNASPFSEKQYQADLSNIGEVDSAGLAFLVYLRSKCMRSGGELVFRNIPEKLTEIAEIAGVQQILNH